MKTKNVGDNKPVEVEIVDKKDVPFLQNSNGVNYVGEIVSVHDGYSYIGKVKRRYETINTNGDVFIPQEFTVGVVVEFSTLNTDLKRPGKYRVEEAKVVNGALVKTDTNSKINALVTLTERSTYHSNAKVISEEKAIKAAENIPFAEMLFLHERYKTEDSPDIVTVAEDFISRTFANLNGMKVSSSIKGDVDTEAEQSKVSSIVEQYKQSDMSGQVDSINQEYAYMKGVREVFAMMHQNGILSMETVIPIKYLPDLLVTSPVWFVHSMDNLLRDNTNEKDPLPDDAIKFFCNQVGSKEFAWFYQIYNRRTRPFKQFSGRDIMPPPLLEITEKAKRIFDYVVIATPYHDIASKEWADPDWLRNIDPFLFGFVKNLPYMFLLGRWSATGLFPLMCDMIADTIDHLRINKDKLGNFMANTYWYMGDHEVTNDSNYLASSEQESKTGKLIDFADNVIKAYEENRLFEFLRGEKKSLETAV
jgi:hypothetical protein